MSTCFATTPFATDWRAANGQTLATLTSLAADSQAVRLMIGDSGATITGSSKGIDGAMNGVTLDARIFYVNDAANTVLADLLFDYRGLQTSFARYNAYEASVDTTEPTFAEIVGRPALANPVPVQMTTLNL